MNKTALGKRRDFFARARAIPSFAGFFACLFVALAVCGCAAKRQERVDANRFSRDVRAALGGRPGVVLVMDARSGEILGVTNRQQAGRAHPVGSVFKLITAVAALESGAIPPGHSETCRGKTIADGREAPCWLRGGHGTVNLREALAVSCNVYFYRIGRLVSPGRVIATARKFGLGERVANRLWGESPGSLPDFIPPTAASRIAAGDTGLITATPLQMAVMTTAIATGRKVVPHESKANAAAPRELRYGKSLPVVRDGMVASASHGTADRLANIGWPVAGKTGTAPSPTGGYNAWFVGFTPVASPEIAVVVFLENGRGGPDAVPVARRVFLAYYNRRKEN